MQRCGGLVVLDFYVTLQQGHHNVRPGFEQMDRRHETLTNPQLAAQGIAALAFAAGFGDLSYFNRTFKRAYAVTPSDLRAFSQT